ncbi:hypothetical protein JCM16303_000768 [Sporobolomyces ruberrimus]
MLSLTRRLTPSIFARCNIRFSSSSTPSIPPLIGSAPSYPRHLVIHTPQRSTAWPSHLESVSPLYKHLGEKWSKSSETRLKELGFGVSEGGDKATGQSEVWDPSKSKFDQPPTNINDGSEEVYSATLYPDFLHFSEFSLSSLPSFEQSFLSLPPPTPSTSTSSPSSEARSTHIYVCTHGSRDCRCGDLGEKLYQSLLSEIKRRKLGGELTSSEEGREGVRIGRIAHIGGHKYAANALVYREGGNCDWYGLLNEQDVPTLIDTIDSATSEEPLYSNWRGRLGLDPTEVKSLYQSHLSSSSSTSSGSKKGKEKMVQELGERVVIKFVTFEGEELELVGYEGESLMQVAKRGDAPSILATCGGNCECATCHVHIPPLLESSSSASAESDVTIDRQPIPIPDLPTTLPEMTDEEDEQLDFAIGTNDDSRLACQIPVTKELGEWVARGGRIHLPRY